VLRRPQPLSEPDIIAADDAIRSRARHVLSGGGAALILFCVSAQAGSVHPVNPSLVADIGAARMLGVFLVAVAGWIVASGAGPRAARHTITQPHGH
jgi:hypothetical protein